ncbi:MAG: ABC transporter ATP-binding protein [Acidimicrobiales bacterium]
MSALEVRGITVRFGGRLALDSVDLLAEAGVVTGLIGPNGAGKTTLFNVICGLLTPAEGTVRIGTADVTRLAPFKRARRGLGRTFQRLELFGLLTVRENVRLAAHGISPASADAITDGLLERLGIGGIQDVRTDRLPTGQARVVELARALATRPTVLLLDEPASGQDDDETTTFASVLVEVAREGIAVVLVEHDIQLVMDVCQQIHVLDLGCVLASGTPEVIRRDEAVLAAYLGQPT